MRYKNFKFEKKNQAAANCSGSVCVTGASSGIGNAFAKKMATYGWNLILVARRKEKLEFLAEELQEQYKIKIQIKVADLSKESECKKLADFLCKEETFMLAGFGLIGSCCEMNINQEMQMIDVNIKAMQFLTRSVLKKMQKREKGVIINVASVAGLLPGGPFMATYYATKAYVTSWTLSLQEELRLQKSKVKVYALCPGPVQTNFTKKAGGRKSLDGISPNACVHSCLNGMNRGQTIIIPGMKVKIGTFFSKLIPRKIVLKIIAKGQQKKLSICKRKRNH